MNYNHGFQTLEIPDLELSMLSDDIKTFVKKTNKKNKRVNGKKIRFAWTRRKRKG